jgi:hypothetical protein
MEVGGMRGKERVSDFAMVCASFAAWRCRKMNSCADWSTLGYETIFTPLGSFTLSLSFHVSLVSWQQTEGRVSAISLNSRLSIDFALQNSKKIVFDAESGMKRQQGQGQQFQTKLEKDEIAEWWCCGFKREGKKKWVNATCRDAEKSGPSDWSWHAPTNGWRKN